VTDEQKGFLKACQECRDRAGREGRQLFVTRYATTFFVISDFDKSWLFRAFPGGRTELSMKGKAIVEDLLEEDRS